MKQVIFLSIFLIISLTSYSQKVLMYRAYQSNLAKINGTEESDLEWGEWRKSNTLIAFDTGRDVIKIFTKETRIYYITEVMEKLIDENGDMTKATFETVYDGNSVNIVIEFLTDPYIVRFYIFHTEAVYVYDCKAL